MSGPKTALAAAFSRVLERALGLPPAETRDVAVTRNLPVPMRDGVVLLADRYAPKGGDEGTLPTVLVRSPYGKGGIHRRSSVARSPSVDTRS